jgi:lipoyl(octanoyl) transferase
MHAYVCDLQTMPYQDTHRLQLDCLGWLGEDRDRPDIFLVVEHPAVFTLGRRGIRDSILVDENFLHLRGISVIHVERGGDITYHGPGQVVVYPIISLRRDRSSVKDYVHSLEELMIATLSDFGIRSGRDERNRGVWVGDNKIGSIGISIRHGIAFHGMALNVTLDLAPFGWINPCGLAGVGATSFEKETNAFVDFDAVKSCLIKKIGGVFNRTTEDITHAQLMEKING